MGGWYFFYFRFLCTEDAPTIITTSDHPLPPIRKIAELSTGICGFCGQLLQVVDSIGLFIIAYRLLTKSVLYNVHYVNFKYLKVLHASANCDRK